MTNAKGLIVTLRSTFESLHERWGLADAVDFAISPAMHDLYLEDFPRQRANPLLTELMRTKATTV